ncbi:MAG: alpha/beta hydrolase [Candidatus Kariarchaeaceae archaeon]|jgi:enterochelin esterase-like enzyme
MNLLNSKYKIIGVLFVVGLILSSITYILYMSSKSDEQWDTDEFTLNSAILGNPLDISVGLPQNYDPNAITPYQTVYLLDGMYYFDDHGSKAEKGGVISIMDRLITHEMMPEAILVGISYDEFNDERERYTHWGAVHFRDFFREELIPYIEDNYHVNPSANERTLLGHSGPGQFVVYALMADGLRNETTFFRFVAISGAFEKSRTSFKEEEQLHFEGHMDALANRILYMSVGSEDDVRLPWGWIIENDTVIYPNLLDLHRTFTNKLENRGYTDFAYESTEHDGYGHWDIQELAFEDGLKWVFQQGGSM